jgi:hypothetical protein
MSNTEVGLLFLGAATVCASFFVLGLISGASMSAGTVGLEPVNKYENPVWFWFHQVGWLVMALGFAAIGGSILL